MGYISIQLHYVRQSMVLLGDMITHIWKGFLMGRLSVW